MENENKEAVNETLTPEDIAEIIKKAIEGNQHMYKGCDNSKKLKSVYFEKVIKMTDDELYKECKDKIWLSAYAANNFRSDYHYQCDFCSDEAARRGKTEIYNKAHKSVSDTL